MRDQNGCTGSTGTKNPLMNSPQPKVADVKKLLRTKKTKKDIALIMKSHFFNKEGTWLNQKQRTEANSGPAAAKYVAAAAVSRSSSHGQDSFNAKFGHISIDLTSKKDKLLGEPIRLKN